MSDVRRVRKPGFRLEEVTGKKNSGTLLNRLVPNVLILCRLTGRITRQESCQKLLLEKKSALSICLVFLLVVNRNHLGLYFEGRDQAPRPLREQRCI